MPVEQNINDVNIQTLSGNVSRDLQSGSATLGSVGTSGIQGSTLAKGKNINYSAGGTSLNNLDVGFSTQNGNISARSGFLCQCAIKRSSYGWSCFR